MARSFIARRLRNAEDVLSLDTEALRRYPDLIDLSIGEPDQSTDPRLIEAAFRDTRAGYTHYGDPMGDPELVEAVCRSWEEDHGEPLSPEEVIITASACLGMMQTLMAVLDPGDEVLVFSPFYPLYRSQIELAGGVCVEVPTCAEEGYALSEARIRSAVTGRTKAFILNSPNNPTGHVCTREELEMLSRLAREKDLLAICDEVYTFFLYNGATHIPLRSLPGMRERTVTVTTFSKNYLMTGWRVGTLLAPADIIRAAFTVNASLIYTAPAPSQRAALEGIRLRQELRQELVSLYRRRVETAARRAALIPWMEVAPPEGAIYLFPSVRKTGLTSQAVCDRLLEEAHVLLTPGSVFGSAGEGSLRISCTVPEERLHEAFDRMEKVRFCASSSVYDRP